MKYLHLMVLTMFFSCGQNAKENKKTTSESNTREPDSIITQQMMDSIDKEVSHTFEDIIAGTKNESLPRLEMTNFDSFIDEDDHDEVDVKTLKLEQIYPQFYTEGYNYKAISKYKIPVSNNFQTMVITILKGDNEMESVLINYDTEGNILAHEIVAYDEIAESMSRVVSRISENRLTVNRIFWGNIREVEEIEFEINGDGTIKKLNAQRLYDAFENYTLIQSVLMDLKLDWVQTKTDLITAREHLENPNETIVVIPEIVGEGEQYFNLNSHIVIVDNRTGNILHKFFESLQTNQWGSDAIELQEIQISPTLYKISENKKAFGIRVSYHGMSMANPYENETLSLFIKFGDSIKKILSDYTVKKHDGEWDGDCEGAFVGEEKNLVMSTNKTYAHFNVSINNRITKTKYFKDRNGECQSNETVENKEMVLKFNGHTYAEYDAEVILLSEYSPEKLGDVHIDNFGIDHAYQLGSFKIVTGNYIPQEGQIMAPIPKRIGAIDF